MFPVPVSVQANFISFSLYIKAKLSLSSMQSSAQESTNAFHLQKVL